MAYENLALKYRPLSFSDVIGQDSISKTIANSIDLGRIAHAYLFYGPRGCGKTSTARILAKSLNCQKPEKHDPCNKCASCLEISQSRSIDVMEIDAASHTQVQNVRDVIIDNINLAPSRDKYKIYILDEVHMLSNSAFNALLKTMEEPPAHVVFIMATTEINKVPLTIVSRCQTFRFRPIKEEVIMERLVDICKKEKFAYEDAALKLVAQSSSGAMRDAITALDRIASFSNREIKFDNVAAMLGHAPFDVTRELFSGLLERNAAAIHSAFSKANGEGYDILTIIRDLRNYVSECFLVSQGFNPSDPQKQPPRDVNPFILAKLARKLNRIIDEVKFSDNPSLAAEMAFYSVIETPLDLEALVKKIEKMEGSTAEELPGASESRSSQKKSPILDNKSQAAEPVQGGDHAALWQKFLQALLKEKISIYNFLISSRITFIKGDEWKIDLKSEFQKEMVEKNLELIGRLLESVCRVKVRLLLSVSKAENRIEEISNSPEKEAGTAPEPDLKWQDVDSGNPDENFPEYKKINKVFPGKIKKINKIEK